MADSIADFLRDVDFFETHRVLVDSDFFTYIFPFLLVYALLVTVLPKAKIFQSKDGRPLKPIITLISLIVSIVGITFEISPGFKAGDLMMMMFPNISALTIGTLTLYIVGSILGQDFFKGLFRKDVAAYVYFSIGAIGLGSVIFYVGIAMGIWDFNPLDQLAHWNIILAVAFFILGIVFIAAGLFPIGLLLLFVVVVFAFSDSGESILTYFIDPVVFVVVLFVILLSWMNSEGDQKKNLARSLNDAEKTRKQYHKEYGTENIKPYQSRVYDVGDVAYKSSVDKWNELYPDEKDGWNKYK